MVAQPSLPLIRVGEADWGWADQGEGPRKVGRLIRAPIGLVGCHRACHSVRSFWSFQSFCCLGCLAFIYINSIFDN